MSTVKFKCKTPTMATVFSGELVEGMESLLCNVGDAPARVAALARLQATHERICGWEHERREADETRMNESAG